MTGKLPEWMSDKSNRRQQNARSKRQEEGIAKEVGGRRQPGSGSSFRAPQDIRGVEHLIQHKYRERRYTLNDSECGQVFADAIRDGREPAFIIEFASGRRLLVTELPPS